MKISQARQRLERDPSIYTNKEYKVANRQYIQGGFFYCSAQKTTKYKEKLKYQNCSANCSSHNTKEEKTLSIRTVLSLQ